MRVLLDTHALHVHRLPDLHRDPFDRLLIAQSRLENLPILYTGRTNRPVCCRHPLVVDAAQVGYLSCRKDESETFPNEPSRHRNVHARHQKPQLFPRGLRRRYRGDDLSPVHDGDPIRQAQNLVQLSRDEENGGAGIANGHDLAVDIFDRAHVQPACGLGCDQKPYRARVLALPRSSSAGCRRRGSRRWPTRPACGCRSPAPIAAHSPRSQPDRGWRRGRRARW